MSKFPEYNIAISRHYWVRQDTNLINVSQFNDSIQVVEKENGNEQFKNVPLWEIYADQVKGWYLDIASEINSEHGGFVKLMVAMAFFESHAPFRCGKSNDGDSSTNKFKDIFKVIFNPSDITPDQVNLLADILWGCVRNSLFHTLQIRYGIILTDETTKALEWDIEEDKFTVVKINPDLLLDFLQNYFESYLMDLRQGKDNLRETFVEGWKIVLSWEFEVKRNKSYTEHFSPTQTPIEYSGSTVLGHNFRGQLQPILPPLISNEDDPFNVEVKDTQQNDTSWKPDYE